MPASDKLRLAESKVPYVVAFELCCIVGISNLYGVERNPCGFHPVPCSITKSNAMWLIGANEFYTAILVNRLARANRCFMICIETFYDVIHS